MQTRLTEGVRNLPEGREAEEILRKCVHCGFCTATCPTYRLLGDELDGPRGRIYLIKQALEGTPPTRATQMHLDRCLACRNCETTCPSGVEYARLLEIGRRYVDAQVPRPLGERLLRLALRTGLPSPSFFARLLQLGSLFRPLLPKRLRAALPRPADASPGGAGAASSSGDRSTTYRKKIILPTGCVQPALRPEIDAATRRVLQAAGFETVIAANAGCCGAIRLHTGDPQAALADMRRNIDAWWPLLTGSAPVEAIVLNASGCGSMIAEYGRHLERDPEYADKARRVSAAMRPLEDVVESCVPALLAQLSPSPGTANLGPVAVQTPCSLQHGLQRGGDAIARVLGKLGFETRTPAEAQMCCGSAGTYSLLQPHLAASLRARKLTQLGDLQTPVIVSGNIGCITHLQAASEKPVRHWIEVVDAAMRERGARLASRDLF